MKALVSVFNKISHVCDKIGFVLTLLFMVTIVGSIATGVVCRVFFTPLLWADELSRLSMVAGAFVAGSVGMARGQLVRFDFAINKAKGKGRALWYLVVDILVLVFLFVFLRYGIAALPMYNKSISMTLPITLVWPAVGMVLGGAFMAIHGLSHMLQHLYQLCGGDLAAVIEPEPANEEVGGFE